VWTGSIERSPEGRWLSVGELRNLSDTSAVDETHLTVSGPLVAWAVSDEGNVTSIQLLDLEGSALTNSSALSFLERWQTQLTLLQETGRLQGFCRRVFRFDSPRDDVSLAWSDAGLSVESRGVRNALRCSGTPTLAGLSMEPTELGSPGDLITWAVDRVRAVPWIGTERMQWIKAVAFGLFDRFETVKHGLLRPDSAGDGSGGGFLTSGTVRKQDPRTGWPPSALIPILKPPLPMEGVFRSLDDDPFAVSNEQTPSPFAVSFLRPDATRPESQIYIVAWDPRLLELHAMTGTREPKTATGETGPGMVPRDEATISRLAGAFNGGFQATHGEFGMMAQRIVYLPPKPFAATVAEQVDGTTAFGTWPDDESIPETMIGFRQNLTPLIADGTINPYSRTWWGGVPLDWQGDTTRTVRTGLCMTADRFIAYFYGSSISADHLAQSMRAARCEYGLHLDMNPGHTGFEFYRTGRTGTLPAIPHKLDGTWEARGGVQGAAGWDFMGRRMLRSMHLMHFPRYIRTDSRDFFYLTHRNVLPPERANTKGLTQGASSPWEFHENDRSGYPPAMATQRLHPLPERPELELQMVALDAKWLQPCRTGCATKPAVLRSAVPAENARHCIYYRNRRFDWADAEVPPEATAIACGKVEPGASRQEAVIGVMRGEWLIYAEVARGERAPTGLVLKQALDQLGVEHRVYLEHSLGISFDAKTSAAPRHNTIGWWRDDTSMVGRLFKETPVVAPSVWQPLQAKRVRYFKRRAAPTRPPTLDPAELTE
jgi:hypothetical protein